MNNTTTTYTYSITRPHAVEVVTNPDGTISNVTQNITYTPFNKAETITEGDYKLTYTYGPDQQRRKSELKLTTNDLPLTTIYYAGNYEKIETGGNIYEVHYITSPAGLIAINVRHNNTDQLYYVYTDHLGSIVTLTDDAGTVVYEQNFDAWGRERNPNTWDYTASSYTKPEWLIRGFTGHEHLNTFALINMNGRCYDPVLGRMLSPDNYVQDATGTQAFNRYSYAGNNPLVYVDPDGEFVQYIIGAVIGGFSGYMMADAYGYKGWDKFWYTLGGAAIGAATAGVGTAVSSSAGVVAGGAAGGAVSGAGFGTMGGYAAGLRGGDLFGAGITGMFSGAITGLTGSAVGGAIGGGWGALAGGATSNLTGQLLANEFSFKDINWKSVGISGATSFGMYHLGGYINYQKYKNSGVTFDGKTLSYRQFMGMSADFQRSKFWSREFGGVLKENGGYVHRYKIHPLLNPEGQTRLHWDVENFPADTWATMHAHWAKPGTVFGNGIAVRYHSPLDIKFDNSSYGYSSFVINRYDASFNSIVGPGSTMSIYNNNYFMRYPFYFYPYGY